MITNYRRGGREVLMSFTCGRCGKIHTEPYDKQLKTSEGNIQHFKVPEGWLDDTLNNPILCDDCHKEYRRFMKYERVYEKEI